MKNQKKLIVIATIIALLICVALMTCAIADEKIYTSPTFKLPAEKIQEWVDDQPEEETPEEVKPEEETPADDESGDESEDDWLNEDPREDEEDGEPVAETPAEGTEAQGEEGGEPAAETPAEGTEAQGEEGEVVGEAKAPERTVMIRSSQGDVVTEGEIIYLTSKLKGFDGLDIDYQWQVDRGDGAGWVDVEGANRSKHMIVANKETNS